MKTTLELITIIVNVATFKKTHDPQYDIWIWLHPTKAHQITIVVTSFIDVGPIHSYKCHRLHWLVISMECSKKIACQCDPIAILLFSLSVLTISLNAFKAKEIVWSMKNYFASTRKKCWPLAQWFQWHRVLKI